MILTCPSCNAQFNVDPNALGAAGRTVRCGKCKHQWLAKRPLITMPADGIVFAPSDNMPEKMPSASGIAALSAKKASNNIASNQSAGTNQAAASGLRVDGVDSLTSADLPAFSADMQPVATRNAIIAALVLAGLLSIPIFMALNPKAESGGDTPHAVQDGHAPKTALEIIKNDDTHHVDVAKDIEKKDAEKGIVLDGTPTTLLKEDMGRTILSIEGALINRGHAPKTVPVLQAQALNAKGKVVKEWIIPIANKDMEPGQRQTFTYSAPFTEQGVVDIAFHFL